jgi:hypothetical protein
MRPAGTGWILAIFLSAGACVHATPGTWKPASQDQKLADDLLAGINRLRADPRAYIQTLKAYLKLFQGDKVYRPGEPILLTREGPAAVKDAIRYLGSAPKMPALKPDPLITRAAGDHVADLGPTGQLGHFGSDGSSPSDRLRRYGQVKRAVGESLGFGYPDAGRMLLLLVVDDGVPGRGHRKKFFDPAYRLIGIACGPHKVYGHMCVLDFAGGFESKN